MPAPMQLTTDWITIGTSGPTVDGRNISEQMLTEAAETYDPDEYTAVISSDHMLWMFGNFGEVCKLRTAADKKGRTALQAQIHPNRRLILMNSEGQRMHTSMELQSDFAGSGKTYLTGLAVTDEPASLGTTAMKFSRKDQDKNLMIGEAMAMETLNFNEASGEPSAKDPSESFFKNLFQRLGSELKSSETSATQEVDEMTPEQFNALKELHEKQLAATENLATLLNKGGAGEGTEQGTEEEGEGNQKGGKGEKLTAFMNTVSEKLETLSKNQETFSQKLETATAGQLGTQVPPNTGAGAEASFV
ncbi:GPO family capsid scaffolding protein [Endozoicomonas ascidiicola]|uniref:GPO family capsid scaffolding protein n=1 Tax=Endozoicomonas ascidiicola TaxID=1698521 RepID=UPI000836ACD7|nr:GPO family capsid scaffolding protein [Endozoicomonas ascidiicola]